MYFSKNLLKTKRLLSGQAKWHILKQRELLALTLPDILRWRFLKVSQKSLVQSKPWPPGGSEQEGG